MTGVDRSPGATGGAGEGWSDITITLTHYFPRSKGARVIVTSTRGGAYRHVVSSASGEGMTVDDPNITGFLAWAKDYYHGAAFQEIPRREGDDIEPKPVVKPKRGRRRALAPSASTTDGQS